MRKSISVGVLGCGYWGPLLVRNFKNLANCQLTAVCDVNEVRLKHMRGLYPDVEYGTDHQQFLNGSGLDAVVIATPVKHHHALAKASLNAGKHTFIEKPMAATSIRDASIWVSSKKTLTSPGTSRRTTFLLSCMFWGSSRLL